MTLKTPQQQHHHHNQHHQQQQQHQSSSSSSLISWIFHNRRRRIFFMVLCSPILLPLLCVSFPVLFLCQLYLCLCLRRRRRDDGDLRRCEEGRAELDGDFDGDDEDDKREIGWMLLQRYLEDQLRLVGSVVSVYDCGDDDDDEVVDVENRRPFLI